MDDVLGIILVGTLVIVAIALVFSIISYIISGLFLYRIAGDARLDKRWMAWVPIVNNYYFGKIAGTLSNDEVFTRNFMIAYIAELALTFMNTAVSNSEGAVVAIISILMLAVEIAFLVFTIMAYNRIFKAYNPDDAFLYTILAIIPIVNFIFIIWFTVTKTNKRPPYNGPDVVIDTQYTNYQ